MDLLAPGESAVVFRTKIWHFLRTLVQHQPLSSLLTTLAAAALRCAIPRLWAWSAGAAGYATNGVGSELTPESEQMKARGFVHRVIYSGRNIDGALQAIRFRRH